LGIPSSLQSTKIDYIGSKNYQFMQKKGFCKIQKEMAAVLIKPSAVFSQYRVMMWE